MSNTQNEECTIDKYAVQRKDNNVFCKNISIVTYFYQALNVCYLYDDFFIVQTLQISCTKQILFMQNYEIEPYRHMKMYENKGFPINCRFHGYTYYLIYKSLISSLRFIYKEIILKSFYGKCDALFQN